MRIEILYPNEEWQTIDLDCDKQDIGYQEDDGIAKIFVKDELTHIINLNHVAFVRFDG